MVDILDIKTTFFTILGYPLSYLEFFGLVTGILAVLLSSLANVWSWPLGIVNVILSFFLFYQVQLYPDMMLQVFFLVTNLMGWWRWTHPAREEEDRKRELRISHVSMRETILYSTVSVVGVVALSLFAQQLHHWLPSLFSQPSAAPYLDSTITVLSMAATFLMVQKRVECWLVWIGIDVLATYVYFIRDIKFYSLMYFVFCLIAAYGYYHWTKEYRSYPTSV
jgi:nicotinamide mononucleotide transporter